MTDSSRKLKYYSLLIILALLALVVAFGVSRYRRIHAYDELISGVAASRGLDPRLVRSVIWRESRFRYDCRGKKGEIGLMQLTENAAKEWAAADGVVNFRKNDLFNPETNIRAGTWYLKRSISNWSKKANPLPYALAEYNAGRSNCVRWASGDGGDANKFWDGITYPKTKQYVRDVLIHYRRYR